MGVPSPDESCPSPDETRCRTTGREAIAARDSVRDSWVSPAYNTEPYVTTRTRLPSQRTKLTVSMLSTTPPTQRRVRVKREATEAPQGVVAPLVTSNGAINSDPLDGLTEPSHVHSLLSTISTLAGQVQLELAESNTNLGHALAKVQDLRATNNALYKDKNWLERKLVVMRNSKDAQIAALELQVESVQRAPAERAVATADFQEVMRRNRETNRRVQFTIGKLQDRVKSLKRELSQAAGAMHDLRDQLAATRTKSQQAMAIKNAELDALRQDIAVKGQTLVTKQNKVEVLTLELDNTRMSNSAAMNQVKQYQLAATESAQAMAGKDAELQMLRQDIIAKEQTLLTQQDKIETLMLELDTTRASNAVAKDQKKQTETEFDSANEAIDCLKHLLASADDTTNKRLKFASKLVTLLADQEKAKQAKVLIDDEAAKAETMGIQRAEEKQCK